MKPTIFAAVTLSCACMLPQAGAQNHDSVSPECRGVAAGVVAAMKASGEVSGAAAGEAAVIAARRACQAALDDLGGASVAGTTGAKPAAAASSNNVASNGDDGEEPTLWDLLTRDRELKPGNERLRRLKTQ